MSDKLKELLVNLAAMNAMLGGALGVTDSDIPDEEGEFGEDSGVVAKFETDEGDVVEYKIKFYHPNYFNIDINRPLQVFHFSDELELACEVDEEKNIVYIADKFKDEVMEFLK